MVGTFMMSSVSTPNEPLNADPTDEKSRFLLVVDVLAYNLGH